LIISDIDISEIYYYSNNYALSAWSCHDCDSDGLLDAQEDTNGDGTYSVGDTTDMCDPCDPIHPLIAEMSGDTIMCSVEDEVYIYVNITNAHPVYGWEPYIIEYTDGTDTTTVNNYFSGDPITVSPTATDTFTIVSVTDSRGCTPDTIRGSAIITVEGPIAISVDPTDVVECSGNS